MNWGAQILLMFVGVIGCVFAVCAKPELFEYRRWRVLFGLWAFLTVSPLFIHLYLEAVL